MTLLLATASQARRALMEAAGFGVESVPHKINEDDYKAQEKNPQVLAKVLAQQKAASLQSPGQYILGCDQVAALEDLRLDKPKNMAEARSLLHLMSGKTHQLFTAVSIYLDGRECWLHEEQNQVTLWPLKSSEIEAYLNEIGENALTQGVYQLEGPGIRLIQTIEGDYFSALGLPLLPLIAFMRRENICA